MQFSFELLSVGCESVLSTEDSEWGAEDGIRVYFIVLTTGGFHGVLVSGREFPPPDGIDNYYFVPGKTLTLDQFPPQNAGSWELLPPAGLSDVDSVMVTVLGVNEGLPYLAGGGGFGGSQKASLKVFEEIAQKGSEEAGEHLFGKAGEAVGGAAFGAAWSLMEGLIEELNHSPECRGVAFCYPIEISMRKLLLDHLWRKDTTHRIDGASPSTGLGLVATSQHPADCGSPRYSVELGITRIDPLGIAVEDVVVGEPRQGERTAMPVEVESCRPPLGAEMQTWHTYVDRTITFTPSHSYASLKPTWHVQGTELQRDEETLNLTRPVNDHTGGEVSERPVAVRCEQIKRDGKDCLVLHTRGEDGIYSLEVSLRFNFEGVHPLPPNSWVEFRKEVVWVSGSELEGNDAWKAYLPCVMDRRLKGALEDIEIVPGKPGKKPDEIDIATIKRGIRTTVLFDVLSDHFQIR
jgi:hypothetical protein